MCGTEPAYGATRPVDVPSSLSDIPTPTVFEQVLLGSYQHPRAKSSPFSREIKSFWDRFVPRQ
eukprot:627115-Rhodomonas_salina.2